MDNDILQLLESVGLKPKEASVYLALLELGKGNITQIAKLSGLKRSILYIVLNDLIKKGYVSQSPDKKINEYSAQDPSIILTTRKTAVKNFTEMLPLLQALHNRSGKRPKIHFIETKEGIWNTFEKINYSKEQNFFITSYSKIEKIFPGSTRKWVKNCKKGIYKFTGKNLIPDNPKDIELGKMIKQIDPQVRCLPNVKQFSMDFEIYENKLVITSLEKEPFMVLIESAELVNSMKPFFEIAWKNGKPI